MTAGSIANTPDLPADQHSPNYSSDLLPALSTKDDNFLLRCSMQVLPMDLNMFTSMNVPFFILLRGNTDDVPVIDLPSNNSQTGTGNQPIDKKSVTETMSCANCDTFFTRNTKSNNEGR